MKNIYVLCGGKSVEHEISLRSATAVLNSLNKDKYRVHLVFISHEGQWIYRGLVNEDVLDPTSLAQESKIGVRESIADFLTNHFISEDSIVFPVLHGPNGEDGKIQGFLETLDVAYVGNPVLSSALAMDKIFARDIFAKHKIPQTDYKAFNSHEYANFKEDILDSIIKDLGSKLYVKPSNLGSSVGISRASSRESLEEAIDLALVYDSRIIVERELIAREMQVSVIGNEEAKVSLPGEFITEDPFFDYESKYFNSKLIQLVPADLDETSCKRVRELALKTYKALDCKGLARVDIFIDQDNELYVNEVNTMPGFTSISMTPVLWEATDGTTYPDLVEILINLGLEAYENKKRLSNRR